MAESRSTALSAASKAQSMEDKSKFYKKDLIYFIRFIILFFIKYAIELITYYQIEDLLIKVTIFTKSLVNFNLIYIN